MTAAQYLDGLGFEPDRFQVEAATAIDEGQSVVVAAPTGAGKTVVAEAAIHRALERDERAVYTTPIKALSNQKFGDLVDQYGAGGAGLLTGDNSINGTAPVVVMTTEVLRNMMYANSADLESVGVVILDEVHYLQDRARGGVWEEIIVHLDLSIPLVCLSATVANAGDFAAWIGERRGPTALVQETERPVPLEATYLVRDRFAGHELRLFPVFSGSRPNERVASMLRRDRGRRHRYVEPRRHETSEHLAQRGLLPAIYFIFSRKGCEAAARSVVDRGLRLTTGAEADRIEEIAALATSHVDPLDLEVLGYAAFISVLRRGVATHHAGMVPALKEAVEQLFAAGLVKLVFATETLALGINMPARTVVLESLSKFTGDGHETLQPGDFTQLTGRAGRRGIDDDGTAVVLHSRYLEFERVAGIAGRGSHPLRSSFRPTYNMAVNLVARYERDRAEMLLGASFAEFDRARRQSDILTDIEAEEERLAELRQAAEHPSIDVWELLDDQGGGHARRMAEFAASTGPGDVLEWEERGRNRRVAVVAVGRGKQPRVLAITSDAGQRRFSSAKLPTSIRVAGNIDLPRPFRPRDTAYRAQVATLLESFAPVAPPRPAYETPEDTPDVTDQLEAARAARRIERRLESRRRQAAAAAPAVVHRFRAILSVLDRLDYVSGWSLTPSGESLRTLYNELDLVLAETIGSSMWSDLEAPAAAGLASAFTYQARRSDGPETWPLGFEGLGEAVDRVWDRVTTIEKDRGVEPSRRPDPGFVAPIVAWTSGAALHDLFEDGDPGIGDFVRNARHLLDLLRQLDDGGVGDAGVISEAVRSIDRGVVAAAGAV